MRLPILVNGREVVRSWRESPIQAEVRFIGSGDELSPDITNQLVLDLVELTKSLPPTTGGRREFDQKATAILGSRLVIPDSLAADKRFWQWLAIEKLQSVVMWRWGEEAREDVTENRWLGGWKDTFRRLWLRATLAKNENEQDPFALATLGDEDFWVGIVERDISCCRFVVRELVHRFFVGLDDIASQKMEHYRLTLQRLRQIRPSRAFERLSDAETKAVLDDAVKATAIVLEQRQQKETKGSKRKKKTKRKTKKTRR